MGSKMCKGPLCPSGIADMWDRKEERVMNATVGEISDLIAELEDQIVKHQALIGVKEKRLLELQKMKARGKWNNRLKAEAKELLRKIASQNKLIESKRARVEKNEAQALSIQQFSGVKKDARLTIKSSKILSKYVPDADQADAEAEEVAETAENMRDATKSMEKIRMGPRVMRMGELDLAFEEMFGDHAIASVKRADLSGAVEIDADTDVEASSSSVVSHRPTYSSTYSSVRASVPSGGALEMLGM